MGQGKPGQGSTGKGNNKDDKAQPERFRCGKTGHVEKDCRSSRQRTLRCVGCGNGGTRAVTQLSVQSSA